MINYAAIIRGTWDPGGIPPFESPMDLYGAYPQAIAGARTALQLTHETLDFYLISRPTPESAVHRQRWSVFYNVGGPSLHLGPNAEPHPSLMSITTSVYPHSEVQQVIADEGPSDYQGVFAGIIPALILRHRFGPSARPITLAGYGTGTFTPAELSFQDLFSAASQVTVPYDTAGLASYSFVRPAGTVDPPAVWLVTDDASWKVSYCVESPDQIYDQRWDDPDEPAPEFEPLPAPEPVRPNVDY